MQESAISLLSHRAPSEGGGRRFVHRDQRRRRNDLLRLDVVDFQAFQALKASKVELVVQRQDAIELWVGAVWIWQSSV